MIYHLFFDVGSVGGYSSQIVLSIFQKSNLGTGLKRMPHYPRPINIGGTVGAVKYGTGS
jgi:hypothetical protein